MDQDMMTIVVLAVIAGVLLFRLRDVLGTKTGHENPPGWLKGGQREGGAPGGGDVIDFPGRAGQPDGMEPSHDDVYAVAQRDTPVAATLIEAKGLEPTLDLREFVGGARAAYEMILVAFEQGDKDTLGPLLSDDVFDTFEGVIDDRKAKGYSVDARFIGINVAKLEDARLDAASGRLEIDMKFEAELITAVRDESGDVVQGDPGKMRTTVDRWTFARALGSNDPNWLLVGTG